MTELIVFVEGPTEESFVNRVLAPHLAEHDVFTKPRVVPTSRDRNTGNVLARGGGLFTTWKKEVSLHLRQDTRPELRFTTLMDLYGLPSDFPGLAQLKEIKDTAKRAVVIEETIANQLSDSRLLPYVQRHEFEALVFADLHSLRLLLDDARDLGGLEKLARDIGDWTPEDINDNPATAPSKRLKGAIASYVKTLHGPLAVESTGLARLRTRCPRFDAWVHKLEEL